MREQTCKFCGKKFTVEEGKPLRKYCTRECARDAHNKMNRERRREQRLEKRIDQSKNRQRDAFIDRGMTGITTGKLDERLKEARAKGMTYAELQKQKSIELSRQGKI